MLTEEHPPCRFAASIIDDNVNRMTSDAKCRRRALGDKHKRERVERSRPFYQVGVLKAERSFGRNEDVVDGEVVAAGAAQTGGVPGIENFALWKPEKTS